MANSPLFPGAVRSMPAQAADRLIAAGNGDAALLYLYLLETNGACDVSAARSRLKWDGPRFTAAYDALSAMAMAPALPESAPAPLPAPEEPPDYTAGDIAKELEQTGSQFPFLVTEVQRRLGKILSTADLKMLYSLYDFLALPAEVILLLTNWCTEEMARKYGPNHPPRMSQIRREAFLWRRLGIDTAEAAEEHLKKESALRSREGALLALVGVSGRCAVEAERKYFAAWVEMDFPDDAIRMAYERTVLKKQAMNWPYMNSILKNWHQKGLHTVAEIRAKDSAWTPQRPAPAASPAQTQAQTRSDVQWMREFLAREKEKGDT